MLIPLISLAFVVLLVLIYVFAQGNRKTKDQGNKRRHSH